MDGVDDFDSFALYEMPEQFKVIPADAIDILIQMRGDTLAAEDYDLRSEYMRVCKEDGIEPIQTAARAFTTLAKSGSIFGVAVGN